VQILLPNDSKFFFYFQTNITQHQHKSINIHSSESRSITTNVSKIIQLSLLSGLPVWEFIFDLHQHTYRFAEALLTQDLRSVTFKSAKTYVSITQSNPTHQDFYPKIRTRKPQNIRGCSVNISTGKLLTSTQIQLHFRTNWPLQYQHKYNKFYNKWGINLGGPLDATLQQTTHTQLHCHFTAVSCKHFTNSSLPYNHCSLQYNHSSLQTIALTESPAQWHTTVNRHIHSECSTSARIGTRLGNGWTYTNVPQDQSASMPLKGTTTGSLVSALW